MEHTLVQPPEVLKLAGHAVRWNVLTSLACSDYRVQDLVEQLSLPQNLVSYHLRQLREGQLVTERRSTADERVVFYHLDLERFLALYLAAGETLHPAVTAAVTAPLAQDLRSTQVRLRVLFLCTENSARSQMAEGLLRARGGTRYQVFSAGTHPRAVHPLAVKAMAELGIDIGEHAGHRAKGIEEFADKATMNLVVTVCDEAADHRWQRCWDQRWLAGQGTRSGLRSDHHSGRPLPQLQHLRAAVLPLW